jgi:putative DNA primase/helicase
MRMTDLDTESFTEKQSYFPSDGPAPSADEVKATRKELRASIQSQKAAGMSADDIHEALLTRSHLRDLRYHPSRRPELDAEFEKEAPVPAVDLSPSDDALALIFVATYGLFLRYVAEWGKWLAWRGTFWEVERTLATVDLVRTTCRGAGVRKWRGVKAVEEMARTDRRVAMTADGWDQDPFLLNTPSGEVDLKTGEIRPNDPGSYCRKIAGCAPAEPGTPCPLWLDFLAVIFRRDPDLIAYVQRLCGYSLTGSIKEHALFFWHGRGGNGKSVFVSTLAGIMGTYHETACIETFTAQAFQGHSTDLASLHGARLVTAIETEEGRSWAESKIAALTGGDRVKARFMRQDFFTFQPIMKLLIVGNHKPRLRAVTDAMRRRFQMSPFEVKIEKPDKDLTVKLKAEWPAILRWFLDGSLEWQRQGLNPPKAVIETGTARYLEMEDSMGLWIDECCEQGAQDGPSASLFNSWRKWCENANEKPGSRKDFAKSMEQRGFSLTRIWIPQQKDRIRGYRGIRVLPIFDEPPEPPAGECWPTNAKMELGGK